jgi:hypothetical protein
MESFINLLVFDSELLALGYLASHAVMNVQGARYPICLQRIARGTRSGRRYVEGSLSNLGRDCSEPRAIDGGHEIAKNYH